VKNKKLLLVIIGTVAAVLIAMCLILGRSVLTKVNHAVKIAEILQPVLNAENQSMRMNVEAAVDGESFTLGCTVHLVQEGDQPYLVLEENGHCIYVTDNILLLENGKAFKITDEMRSQFAGYGELLPLIASLYEITQITATESDGETAYQIQVSGKQAQQLLAVTFPAAEVSAENLNTIQVSLIAKDRILDRIALSADAKSTQLCITISDFQILSAGEYSIPEMILETAAEVDPDGLFSLTEDLYRLVLALEPFSNMDTIDGNLKLAVDCGLIQLDTTIALSDLKNTSSSRINPETLQALPELLGWLCMEGEISCTKNNGDYVYSLILDQDSMQELSRMILPEIAEYTGNLTEGSVSILLDGRKIASMQVTIKGKINVLLVSIPISVGAEFSFE